MALWGRAAVLDRANGTFAIEEAVVPEVPPGGLILRQELCGVCGTDAHLYRGHLPYLTYPVVLGHECVGTIERLGDGVQADVTGRPVREGDRVYVIPGIRCGKCYYCAVLQQPNLCPNGAGFGFRPYPDQPVHFQGGYADYLWLKPGVGFLKVEGRPRDLCILEPLAIAVHVVSQVHLQPGDTVVVQGAGAIGLLTLALAQAAGVARAIAIGAPAGRLALARQLGADLTIDLADAATPEERVERVRRESVGGYGADVVFECAGAPAALPEGLEMLRRGGSYVVAGHFTDVGAVPLNPFAHLNRKHVTLKGVWSSDKAHFVRARSVVESGRHPLGELVSHVLPLTRVADAIGAMGGSYQLDGQDVRKIAIAGGTQC